MSVFKRVSVPGEMFQSSYLKLLLHLSKDSRKSEDALPHPKG